MNNKKRHYYGGGKNRNRQKFQSERVSINKVYDSNGPSGRQRGNASTLYEKYVTLARDASVSGDRVLSENFMQHAEHYLRIVNSIQEQMQSSYKEYQQQPHISEEQPRIAEDQNTNANIPPQYSNEETPSTLPTEAQDNTKEKTVMRRKTYPFARRKQNEIEKTVDKSSVQQETSLESNNQENNHGLMEEEAPKEVTKPKRTPRKRTTTKASSEEAETTNNVDSK